MYERTGPTGISLTVAASQNVIYVAYFPSLYRSAIISYERFLPVGARYIFLVLDLPVSCLLTFFQTGDTVDILRLQFLRRTIEVTCKHMSLLSLLYHFIFFRYCIKLGS
jgi:hypothetical protein